MKQKLLGTVALLAGLALVQSVPAMAQNPGAKGAQSQNAPSPQNSEQGKAGQDAPKANRAEPRSESREKAAGQREEHQRGAAQQNERGGAQNDRNERRDQSQRQEPQRTPSQREGQANEKSQAQDKKSQAQDKENKTGQSQQTPRDADRGQAQSQPNPTGGDRDRLNQQGQRTPTSGEQPSQEARQAEGTVNLSAEQRTRIRTTVFAGNNVPRVNNVNFSIRVGTVVPTSIRIVEVPPTLIEIYPQWRGHSYFVVRDEIIIVDSGHRIVSVVPVGTGDAAQYGGRDSDHAVGVSMTTEDIRRVQVILRERGYVVEVDGVLGPQTRQAIIAFQRKEGFQATGEIDERTSVALGVGRNQSEGADRGDNQQPTANRPAGQPTTGQGERGNPGRDDHGVDQSRGRGGNSSMDNAPQEHGVQPSEAKPSPKLDR